MRTGGFYETFEEVFCLGREVGAGAGSEGQGIRKNAYYATDDVGVSFLDSDSPKLTDLEVPHRDNAVAGGAYSAFNRNSGQDDEERSKTEKEIEAAREQEAAQEKIRQAPFLEGFAKEMRRHAIR